MALLGATSPTTFTYNVTASSAAGDHSFTGVFSGVDAAADPFSGVQVGGDSSITVAAATTPPSTGGGGRRAPELSRNRAPAFDEGGDASRSVAENSAGGTAVGAPITAN